MLVIVQKFLSLRTLSLLPILTIIFWKNENLHKNHNIFAIGLKKTKNLFTERPTPFKYRHHSIISGKNVKDKKLVSKIDQKFWRYEIGTYFAKLPANLIDVGSRCNKHKTYKKLNPKTSQKNFGSFSILFTLFCSPWFSGQKKNPKQKH